MIKSLKKLFLAKYLGKESKKESNSKPEVDATSSDKASSKSKAAEPIKEEQPKTVPTTNNDVRQKCREMLSNALKIEEEDCQGKML